MTPRLLLLALLLPLDAGAEPTAGEQGFLKAMGRDAPVVKLWPGGRGPDEPKPPKAETYSAADEQDGRGMRLLVGDVEDPSFVVLSPNKEVENTGAALLLCPGGGYGILGLHTVKETAEWMNARGITVVLLRYRVPKRHNGFPMNHQPLQDAQRAMGILRARSAEWGIDPERIGIGGFSAGGHLAASLAVNHAERTYEPIDDFDKVSCRPDFAALLYPAYLTDPIESRTRDAHLRYDRINAKATPPTLIAITAPDKFTIGSVEFYQALRTAKVPSELHLYAEGGHGGAIAKYPFGEWAQELHRFLGDQGILEGPEPPAAHAYKAGSLPEVEPSETLTLGDQRLQQLLGDGAETIPVWSSEGGLGPDESLEPGPETVTSKSRGGTALNITKVTRPTLTILRAEGAKRAVIVCPGGAYQGLAAEHEGTRICQWLNEIGITAVLLKYRVPRRGGEFPKHHHALQDLQRAMRLVRARAEAEAWGIEEFGVCGFSAGGHLCSTFCATFGTDAYAPVEAIDKIEARPDFALLIYPAYLVEKGKVDPLLTNLKRNTMPPLFFASARDDRFTEGMLEFLLVARAAGLSTEVHVYAGGGHGGGIDPSSYPTSGWYQAAERWLGDLGKSLQRER